MYERATDKYGTVARASAPWIVLLFELRQTTRRFCSSTCPATPVAVILAKAGISPFSFSIPINSIAFHFLDSPLSWEWRQRFLLFRSFCNPRISLFSTKNRNPKQQLKTIDHSTKAGIRFGFCSVIVVAFHFLDSTFVGMTARKVLVSIEFLTLKFTSPPAREWQNL